MYIGYSNPARREVRWFSKRETDSKQIYIGRLAEWSKAKKSNPPQGDIWNLGHRWFESTTFHKIQ